MINPIEKEILAYFFGDAPHELNVRNVILLQFKVFGKNVKECRGKGGAGLILPTC